MAYIELNAAEGRRFLPKVKNLFFKPLVDENFFVEPWDNRELGDCAEWRLSGSRERPDQVLFFVCDKELIEFLKTTGELYLFGAYNQINVCQMRARGMAALEESQLDRKQITARLRAAIEGRVGHMLDKLDQKEADERYRLLEEGTLFSFRISAYAYRMYERG